MESNFTILNAVKYVGASILTIGMIIFHLAFLQTVPVQ